MYCDKERPICDELWPLYIGKWDTWLNLDQLYSFLAHAEDNLLLSLRSEIILMVFSGKSILHLNPCLPALQPSYSQEDDPALGCLMRNK